MAGQQYPTLFKQNVPPGALPPPGEEPELAESFIPIVKPEDIFSSSALDEALSKKLGREGLLRVKAMEMVLRFLGGRTAKFESIEKLYDLFYNKIRNGVPKKRP